MTRSGVFNSVHSFTQSAIGPTILVFLAATLIASVVLLALRIDSLEAEGSLESGASREGMFLVNNLIFVVLTFTVLVGTCFPLIVEAVKGKQMSVGRPYFDAMAVPMGAALLFLIGVGPALPWGRATKRDIIRALVPPAILGIVVAVIGALLGVRNPWTIVTLFFGGYALHVTLAQMWLPLIQRMKRGGSFGDALVDAQLRRGRRRFGSYIVHAGATIVLVAIAVSSTQRTTKEINMVKGETAHAAGYAVTFTGIEQRDEPHRQSTIARFNITKNGQAVETMEPRMNQYAAMREPIGTPAVHSTLKGDLYISIMNIGADQQSAGIVVIYTPMVSWIWISVLLMGLGGVVALIPHRSRVYAVEPKSETAPSLGTAQS
jgi:cytochrome c-type biogenesis protein CcmF